MRHGNAVILLLASAALQACGDAGAGAGGDLAFTASAQVKGTVGQVVLYSFCEPALVSSGDLCSSSATNPSGGQPPYHFQLSSGVGFPPVGLSLGLNGILSGTPTVAGTSTFAVCAVDLAGHSTCGTVMMTIAGTITASPGAVALTATSCYPAQCTVSQTITITSPTAWTSSTPGFGSLGDGFVVAPDVGPIGATSVKISYTASIPSPADGFIRFRTTTLGVYVEVPVTVVVH